MSLNPDISGVIFKRATTYDPTNILIPDPISRRISIGPDNFTLIAALGADRPEMANAYAMAGQIVHRLKLIQAALPVQTVVSVAACLRRNVSLTGVTTEFLFAQASQWYGKRAVLETEPFRASEPGKKGAACRRLRHFVQQSFDAVGDEIWVDFAGSGIAHLVLWGGDHEMQIREQAPVWVPLLVLAEGRMLADFVAECLDLPNRSTRGLAYILGLSKQADVYEHENAVSLLRWGDRNWVEDFVRSRYPVPRGCHLPEWIQSVEQIIFEGWVNRTWPCSHACRAYIRMAAENRYNSAYRGGGRPQFGDALFRNEKRGRFVDSEESIDDIRDCRTEVFQEVEDLRSVVTADALDPVVLRVVHARLAGVKWKDIPEADRSKYRRALRILRLAISENSVWHSKPRSVSEASLNSYCEHFYKHGARRRLSAWAHRYQTEEDLQILGDVLADEWSPLVSDSKS